MLCAFISVEIRIYCFFNSELWNLPYHNSKNLLTATHDDHIYINIYNLMLTTFMRISWILAEEIEMQTSDSSNLQLSFLYKVKDGNQSKQNENLLPLVTA